MDLNKIKKELESKEFKVLQRTNEFEWLQCFIEDKPFISFNISIEFENILFRDGNKQISDILSFSNIKELIKHIEDNYQIE